MALLLDLMSGRRSVSALDVEARALVAKWAYKTAATLSIVSNFDVEVPPLQRKSFAQPPHGIPNNVVVVASQRSYENPFYWVQTSSWEFIKGGGAFSEESAKEICANSYKITLQFQRLMLLVAYQPASYLKYVIWKGVHIPLHPIRGACGWYEQSGFYELPYHSARAAFHLGLKLTPIAKH